MAPRLGLIGIVTTDLVRSLAFYRLLGLPVPEEIDGGPHVEIEVAPGVLLAWDSVEVITGMDPSWTPPTGGHRVALSFECEGPDEVDAVYEAVVAAGHHGHLPPWDAFWGQRYAVVHDPDGNAVDLYAPLPTD